MSSSTIPANSTSQRYSYRLGCARINIAHLDIQINATLPPLRPENIARLHSIFKEEGCERLDPENFVPALITPAVLHNALELSDVTQAVLNDPTNLPLLRLPETEQLELLHGRHRLKAAAQHLEGADRWWTVELYSHATPDIIKQHIVDYHSNACSQSDGEIYRRMRQAQLASQNPGKWMARLSRTKQRDVKQLHKKEPELTRALDRLLPFHGLWFSVELGTLHRILTLRCPEEMVRYLGNVYRIWRFILIDDENLAPLLDAATVEEIECLHPSLSLDDSRKLCELMLQGHIFHFIQNPNSRGRILNRLKGLREPILSLHTFLEDTKYLEVTTKPLRQLILPLRKGALVNCFRNIFSWPHEYYLVQDIEARESRRVEFEEAVDVCYLHYLQLVLFCMRHFHALTGVAPRRDRGQNNAQVIENQAIVLTGLARLARTLGFDCDTISKQANTSEDNVAAGFLMEARPPTEFEIDEAQRAELASMIGDGLRQALQHAPMTTAQPVFTTDLLPLEKTQRMGRPYNKSYRVDKKFTYLSTIYNETLPPTSAEFLTTLSVKRYCFIAFYGTSDHVGLRPLPDLTRHDDIPPSVARLQSYEDDVIHHMMDDSDGDIPPQLSELVDTNQLDNEDLGILEDRHESPTSLYSVDNNVTNSAHAPRDDTILYSPISYSLISRGEPYESEQHHARVSRDSLYDASVDLDLPPNNILSSIRDAIGNETIIETRLLSFIREQRLAPYRDSDLLIVGLVGQPYYWRTTLQLALTTVFTLANERTTAMATVRNAEEIERQDVMSVEVAARRDHVLILYTRSTSPVYIGTDLAQFADHYNFDNLLHLGLDQ